MVKETKELFRVVYSDGEIVDKLMVQTYTDKQPFYYRAKDDNHVKGFTNVETSSNDIEDIIKYYKRSIIISEKALKR